MSAARELLNRVAAWLWQRFVGVPLQGHPEDEDDAERRP